MRFTRVKTTLMTGMLAASMVMPGMTAYAALGNEKAASFTTDESLKINKTIEAAKGITIPGTITFKVERYDAKSGNTTTDNGDGTVQPDLKTGNDVKAYPATYDIYGNGVTGKTDAINISEGAGSTLITSGTNYAANGANRLVSTDNILADLEGACQTNGEYTFKITETAPTLKSETDAYGWTAVDDTVYYLHVYVTTNAQGQKEYQYLATKGTAVNGKNTGAEGFTEASTGVTAAYQNKVSSIDFKNTYTKRAGSDGGTPTDENPKQGASLVIEKKVVDKNGNDAAYESSNATYTFKVKLTSSNTATVGNGQNELGKFTYKVYTKATTAGQKDTLAETKTDQALDSSNNLSITIKSNQYIVFEDIPAGVTAKVEETEPAASLNISSTQIVGKANGQSFTESADKSKQYKEGRDTGDFVLGEKENSVVYSNVYQDVTVTGVVTNIAPYVTLVAAAVLAIAAYMGLKNRIAR